MCFKLEHFVTLDFSAIEEAFNFTRKLFKNSFFFVSLLRFANRNTHLCQGKRKNDFSSRIDFLIQLYLFYFSLFCLSIIFFPKCFLLIFFSYVYIFKIKTVRSQFHWCGISAMVIGNTEGQGKRKNVFFCSSHIYLFIFIQFVFIYLFLYFFFPEIFLSNLFLYIFSSSDFLIKGSKKNRNIPKNHQKWIPCRSDFYYSVKQFHFRDFWDFCVFLQNNILHHVSSFDVLKTDFGKYWKYVCCKNFRRWWREPNQSFSSFPKKTTKSNNIFSRWNSKNPKNHVFNIFFDLWKGTGF